MSSRSKTKHTAEIVDIAKTFASASRTFKPVSVDTSKTASLLSIRQHLRFKACIAVKDLEFIRSHYSPRVALSVVTHVRSLLDKEFGSLRIHRHRDLLVVNHHCLETLLAGLLRVQFHSKQISLRVTRVHDELTELCGIPLNWGVGESLIDAEIQRMKQLKSDTD